MFFKCIIYLDSYHRVSPRSCFVYFCEDRDVGDFALFRAAQHAVHINRGVKSDPDDRRGTLMLSHAAITATHFLFLDLFFVA